MRQLREIYAQHRVPVHEEAVLDELIGDLDAAAPAGDSTEASALLRTTIQLGKAFGMETLAEGIEGEKQLLFLQRAGCDSGQGYLFARPMAPESLDELVTRTTVTGTPARVGSSNRIA